MPPVILKPRSASAPLIVRVDAIVAGLLLTSGWLAAGFLGFILLDPHTTDGTRLNTLGLAAAWQALAFAMAARARKGARRQFAPVRGR